MKNIEIIPTGSLSEKHCVFLNEKIVFFKIKTKHFEKYIISNLDL
jgi:hypothetical protein